MSKTNFDRHLDKYLQDPAFAEKFDKAGEEWDIALQLAELRQKAGLSQAQLARKLKTSQQQISRLESPSYAGHSLSMLRRVAEALNAPAADRRAVSEDKAPYPPAKRQAKAETSKTATSKARAGKKAAKKGRSSAESAEARKS